VPLPEPTRTPELTALWGVMGDLTMVWTCDAPPPTLSSALCGACVVCAVCGLRNAFEGQEGHHQFREYVEWEADF
jgi:hypothetical protein